MADEPTQPVEAAAEAPAAPAPPPEPPATRSRKRRTATPDQPVATRAPANKIASDAQAFLDVAYAGQITDSDEQAAAPVEATPEPTPATPAPVDAAAAEAPAEEGGSEEAAPEQAAGPTRKEREAAARADRSTTPEPAPVPQPTREEIIADHERQQAEQRQAEAAARQQREQFAAWTGETLVKDANGQEITAYERARRLADAPIPTLDVTTATQEEWDSYGARIAAINAAKAEKADYDRYRSFLDRVDEPVKQAKTQAEAAARAEALTWMSGHFERGVTDAGVELAPVLQAGSTEPVAEQKVPAMFRAFADAVRSPLEARIEELEGTTAAQLAEIETLTRRLGGHVPQAERGGMPASAERTTLDALSPIHPKALKVEDLAPFMDQLPPAPRRRAG